MRQQGYKVKVSSMFFAFSPERIQLHAYAIQSGGKLTYFIHKADECLLMCRCVVYWLAKILKYVL